MAEAGVLEKYGVEMIGASLPVIHKAEDRQLFRAAMEKIGLKVPKSGFARSMEEVFAVASEIGFPIIIRPSFTLGGTGSGVAYNREELAEIAKGGLDASLIHEIMLEQSALGWKEYELEVMRDKADNVVIICSIENIDPMGVHTGESITVAPAQTLTDVEYQRMRDAAIAIMREIGVETGGSNVQFAIHPDTGEMIVIEMNPRVSRSSALASKATGFPDRQDRRETGRRLHAGRDSERHHPRDDGLLRADDRLLRRQDPPLDLREIPRNGGLPDHLDEVGRRDDGDRPDLPGGAPEGDPLAGDQALRPDDRSVGGCRPPR